MNRRLITTVLLAVVTAAGLTACDTSADTKSKPPVIANPPMKTSAPAQPIPSKAEQFKAFVNENGTTSEKLAVAHVTKVQGAEDLNSALDTARVYTDFTGGLMGEGPGPARLIATAFADWKQAKNGLVSIYGDDGQLITNGNY